ncbi:hypothetical protein SAMN05216360_107274 [Methylobacterium phyllostachyos]|uniref:Uncharacterized protein n=1 Tax=Methylobacterium phyllostachyos TaxID=582672 RepID=A0A1H0AMX6_9HYPH|nr:hypothetical protein [Methylobacterium phyllostachyos]SDN34918.1 hypothetical protein SAMN05216360_107274 [Methylobacterium phyllostachyos]
MSATRPARPQTLALGLILPLALAGTAAAQQQGPAGRSGWVDPPPRAAVSAAAKEPAKEAAKGVVKDSGVQDTSTAQAKIQPEGAAAPSRQAARPEPGEDALPKAAATRVPDSKRAAALERPPVRAGLRRQEAREDVRHEARHAAHHEVRRPHRLAETPAALGAAPGASAERAAAARALTARYLATVSGSGDTMVGAATQFYATRVRFYGRPITTAGLVAEKRSFVQRWPERRYEPRAMQAACDAETCTIRTRVDFRTANPGRGAVSSGEAELVLEVGFAGTRPYILGETGRVLRRSIQAGTLAASPGKA